MVYKIKILIIEKTIGILANYDNPHFCASMII